MDWRTRTPEQQEEMITVELTLQEAMALAGFRYNNAPEIISGARRKIKRTVDRTVLPESDKIHLSALEL